MCEAEAFRFREPKMVVEENLADKDIPYKSKWTVFLLLRITICTRLEFCQLEFIVLELLAEQICHGSSEKD